jgi:hypothetical protein
MKKGKFFSADITNIAQTATYTTTTPAIDVSRAKRCVLQGYATGEDAGANGIVTFHIGAVVGSHDITSGHSTSDLTTVTVTMSGAGQVIGVPVLIDTDGMTALECTSVVNGDAAKDALLVNLSYGLVGRGDIEILSQAD